ncbi:hypothetical protein GCM10011415_19120 [Salipiger pallidus]|uniref:Uncharacterized protein n=1 Tax=Salipiger pallidus TaxID=1775170 RepID=A0A8J2ZJ98_9RHOB|nr:hypothetical protein GCM10011415_19120 [Salipiger pallidus]
MQMPLLREILRNGSCGNRENGIALHHARASVRQNRGAWAMAPIRGTGRPARHKQGPTAP